MKSTGVAQTGRLWETVGMVSIIPKCLRVPCPKCGAKIGDACKLAVLCHDERIALCKEDASQAAARIVREATENK